MTEKLNERQLEWYKKLITWRDHKIIKDGFFIIEINKKFVISPFGPLPDGLPISEEIVNDINLFVEYGLIVKTINSKYLIL